MKKQYAKFDVDVVYTEEGAKEDAIKTWPDVEFDWATLRLVWINDIYRGYKVIGESCTNDEGVL